MATDTGRRSDPLHLAAVALAFVLAALHVYAAVAVERPGATPSIRFLLIGAGFLAGVGVYLTAYFRPVLYLVGAAYAAFLGLLWLVGGMQYVTLGAVAGVFGTAFFVLTIYLFVTDEASPGPTR